MKHLIRFGIGLAVVEGIYVLVVAINYLVSVSPAVIHVALGIVFVYLAGCLWDLSRD